MYLSQYGGDWPFWCWNHDIPGAWINGLLSIIPHLPVSSRVLGCEENLYFELLELTATPTNLANQVKLRMLLTNHAVSNWVDLRDRPKTMGSHG